MLLHSDGKPMTYSPNKPDAGPSPKVDVSQIQTDFSQFASIFANNHTALNDRNQGAHEAVILNRQFVDPGVTEDLSILYTKNAASKGGTQLQLFVQIPKFLPTDQDTTNAPNRGMQLTYNSVNIAGPIYQSFLPGGYLLYQGSVSGNTTPNVLIADTVILSPAPTQILVTIATPNTRTSAGTPIPFNVSTTINTVTNDRFTINSTGNGSSGSIPYSFCWVAIARA